LKNHFRAEIEQKYSCLHGLNGEQSLEGELVSEGTIVIVGFGKKLP